MKLLELPEQVLLGKREYGFFEDFLDFVSGDLFTDTSGDTGAAVANVDAAGGQVTLTTGGTDNNECYLLTTKEPLKIADDKPIVFGARLKFSEANTDDANVAAGVMNAVGADSIVDNGAGLKTNFSGAAFYKVDGGTNWKVMASDGATQSWNVELTAANSLDKVAKVAASSAFQDLRIEIMPISSTKAEVRFFIDDTLVYKFADVTFANATEMNAFVGNKAGGANSEVCTVDYVYAYQLR